MCLPDDPEGNAKLMLSILDCLPRANRVRQNKFYPYWSAKLIECMIFFAGNSCIFARSFVIGCIGIRAKQDVSTSIGHCNGTSIDVAFRK